MESDQITEGSGVDDSPELHLTSQLKSVMSEEFEFIPEKAR